MARARSLSDENERHDVVEIAELDPQARNAVILHASVAAGCALGSLLLSAAAYEVWCVDAAVRSALVVAAGATVADGALIAVTGRADVAAGCTPVSTLNKDDALLVESRVQLRSNSVFGGPSSRSLVSRRVRAVDVDISLRSDAPLRAIDAYGAHVSTDHVGVAGSDILAATATQTDRNVRVPTLIAGGARITGPSASWLMFGLKLLLGRVDEEVVETDGYLPAGTTLTALGNATVNDGRVSLRPHTTLGIMLLLGEGTAALLARNTSRWRWAAGGALALAAIAVWQGVTAWRKAHAAPRVTYRFYSGGEPMHDDDSAGSSGVPTPPHTASLSPAVSIVDPADLIAPSRDVECVACQERQQVACLVPCGHISLCMTCARRLRHAGVPQERRCPICRHSISDVVRVYGATVATPAADVRSSPASPE